MAKTFADPLTSATSLAPGGTARSRFRPSARATFSSLKHPNYRLWFVGQLVSLFGTWMQSTAQGYLIYELTHSPAYLGYVGFAAGLPSLLFTLYGGVVADRVSRRTLLVITQISMMILAFILAGLTFSGLIQPWHIVLLAFFLGVANAFDAPTRQAFVLEMVTREDLTNAIALNSMMFNSAMAVGPAVAGLTYALVGPAWCFTINGVTFLAVIAALLLMKLPRVVTPLRKTSALAEMKAGLRYVASTRVVQIVILNMAVTSLFGMGFVNLIPAWAVKILGGDATTNGLLQSARGIGALTGALMIAALGSIHGKGKLVSLGSFVFPGTMLIFMGIRWLPLALIMMMGIGWGQMVLMNSSNALVQTLVPDELRGRVMSVYTLSFFGFMPIGSLAAGAMAAGFGEPATGVLGSAVMLAFALLIYLRVPRLRQVD
jgi:MFS family permease